MKRTYGKIAISCLLVMAMASAHMPYGVCAERAALRPAATARSMNAAALGFIAMPAKTASSGMKELSGDARLHKTVRAQAAHLEILPTGHPILKFPVSIHDAQAELQRYDAIMNTIKTQIDDKRPYINQGLHDQATRIFKERKEQVDSVIKHAWHQTIDGGESDTDRILLSQSPVHKLRDILRSDIVQYEETGNQPAAEGAAMVLALLNGEDISDKPLVVYHDMHNPTASEQQLLLQKADQEHKAFLAIVDSDVKRRQQEAGHYYQRADQNMRKIQAFMHSISAAYDMQLKRLLSAGAELYALTIADDTAEQTDIDRKGLLQGYIVLLAERIDMLTQYAENIQQSQEYPAEEAQYGQLAEGIKNRAKVLRESLKAPDADIALAAVFNPATQVVHKALLDKIQHYIDTIVVLSEDTKNALDSARVAETFAMIVADMRRKIKPAQLVSANAHAETVLKRDSNYTLFKQKLHDHNTGKALLEARMLVMYQDVVGVIDALIYNLRTIHKRLRHPSRAGSQPIVILLSSPIRLDQLTELLNHYNITAILASQGTLAEHQPITASGRGIPWVRIADRVDLDSLIRPGQNIIIEARTTEGQSRVVLTPSEHDMLIAREREYLESLKSDYYKLHAPMPAVTREQDIGLKVCGNTASSSETRSAIDSGADGIGLFRSEMLVSGYEPLLKPYIAELGDISGHDVDTAQSHLYTHRESLFEHMQSDILAILQEMDTDKPFLFRLFDFKLGDKGDALIALLPSQEQGSNFEDNISPVRADFMTLLSEALLGAIFEAKRSNEATNIIPMFPEVNAPEQIRWFFDTVWPAAISNQKHRLSHRQTSGDMHDSGLIDDIARQLQFAIMAERLGINEALESILQEFPRITAVSIGTNDYTEDLLNAELARYGVHVSRSDPHFSKSFFELQPVVLNRIFNLAETIARHNILHPGSKVTLGVCGDIAGRYEFVLYMLWLKKFYGDNLPAYISVITDKIGDIKSFIRIVEPSTDFSMHGEAVFDALFSADSIHISAIEPMAAYRVKDILTRYSEIPEYQELVLGPYSRYRAELSSLAALEDAATSGKPSSAGRHDTPPAQPISTLSGNAYKAVYASA